VDSVQEGDLAAQGNDESVLVTFTEFAHEPYYLDYAATDLRKLFAEEGGFELDAQSVHFVSKCITLSKPSPVKED
jgi:hypothetical protein